MIYHRQESLSQRPLAEDDVRSNYLVATTQRLIHYHESLWEEEKHYTWWIYIIIGALILLYANHSTIQPWWRVTLLTLVGFFGTFMSITGLRVIRKEGEYLCEQQQIFDRVVIESGIREMRVDGQSLAYDDIEVKELKTVRKEANQPYWMLVTGFFTGKLGIRDYFQLTFVVSTAAFIAVAVRFGLAFFNHFVLHSA
jgi:hypothetical protein